MNGSRTTRFTLDFRLRNLRVDSIATVPVGRPFLEVLLPGVPSPWFDCFIDTGAAVSVVSLPFKDLMRGRQVVTFQPELRNWNGYPCEFGETTIQLHDEARRILSPPLALVGKFLRTPVPFHNDRFIILGMNFLMDNAARLEIAGQPWNLAGFLEMPNLVAPETLA
jgi:hypothetical protein